MTESSSREAAGRRGREEHGARRLGRTLTLHVIAPLGVFYGLRWAGADQFTALLAGALLPAAGAVREIAARRRVSGVHLFVLATMALTVAVSFLSGSPRALLIRNCWGMAALGLWIAASLLTRRPFLYEAARVVLDEDRQRTWESNWERYAAFRRLLWVCSAFWAVACLADTALRITMAATLPVDLVPLLDDVLLVFTLAVILVFQRLWGRSYLRRNGLRIRGVRISALAEGRAEPGAAGAG